jgi:hypothetical protein
MLCFAGTVGNPEMHTYVTYARAEYERRVATARRRGGSGAEAKSVKRERVINGLRRTLNSVYWRRRIRRRE